jgi:hypothetical protein
MQFYLGAHQPHWLRLLDVSLMVSRRTLIEYKTKPRAKKPWFRDSGGFTELNMYGEWTVSGEQFITEAMRDAEEVGQMQYAAPMDWMCEPVVLKRTGLTVRKHQGRTVKNYLDLREKAPELPWVPVLQGWTLDEYLRCLEMYDRAGVDLRSARLVGVGTICRRQATSEAATILRRLATEGLRCHAFGLKIGGIPNVAPFVSSADSLAWSYAARREAPLEGCTTHKNCANCTKYALKWLVRVEGLIAAHSAQPYQLALAF